MADRIFDEVVLQIRNATERTVGVLNHNGTVVSCTDEELCGGMMPDLCKVLCAQGGEMIHRDGKTAQALSFYGTGFDYAVYVEGTDDYARTICLMAVAAMGAVKTSYEEKSDRGSFIKNIITDNILPGDIYIRAKELQFNAEQTRVVFVVRQEADNELPVVETLQDMFSDRQHEFVIRLSETDIAVVKSVPETAENEDLISLARKIQGFLWDSLAVKSIIGIGSPAGHLRELADACKEAQVAIEVGKVFETEKTVISYDNLGIGRLIYQLPNTLCEIFLSEVFKKNSLESLDLETLSTINKFFENNLNVSETSRKLFVHRNTLVYRLEKIKKLTGLDLREFDDAIVFKVALMVKKYLSCRDIKFF